MTFGHIHFYFPDYLDTHWRQQNYECMWSTTYAARVLLVCRYVESIRSPSLCRTNLVFKNLKFGLIRHQAAFYMGLVSIHCFLSQNISSACCSGFIAAILAQSWKYCRGNTLNQMELPKAVSTHARTHAHTHTHTHLYYLFKNVISSLMSSLS